jgi:hypothetical protein
LTPLPRQTINKKKLSNETKNQQKNDTLNKWRQDFYHCRVDAAEEYYYTKQNQQLEKPQNKGERERKNWLPMQRQQQQQQQLKIHEMQR